MSKAPGALRYSFAAYTTRQLEPWPQTNGNYGHITKAIAANIYEQPGFFVIYT